MKRITKIDGTDFIPYSKYLDLEEKYKLMLGLYSDAGKEIKKLKEEIAECDDLREELDFRKRETKRLKEENIKLKAQIERWEKDFAEGRIVEKD